MHFSELRIPKALVALPFVALVLASGGEAAATPKFPSVIQRELKLAGEPACALCHSGGETRRGTVTTPFGATMRSRGLVAYSEPSLVTALQAITAEKKDSDGDGTPDVAELQAGSDPNLAAGEDLPDPPEYGCATTRAGDDARYAEFSALFVIVAFAMSTLRRARR